MQLSDRGFILGQDEIEPFECLVIFVKAFVLGSLPTHWGRGWQSSEPSEALEFFGVAMLVPVSCEHRQNEPNPEGAKKQQYL